ncbi:MAG: helix-turn-helix domain-containing protein [Sphingobium sp.]
MTKEQDQEPGVTAAAETLPDTPGGRLRAAREAQGLSLQDVASRTRIAQRQLESIERDDYEALPGIPYAIGFSRAYARAVGVDDVAIAAQVRQAVSASDLGANRYEVYEPADPARVPSRTLAWVTAAVVVVIVAGFAIWRAQLFTPPSSEEIAQREDQTGTAAAQRTSAPPAPAVQPVVFTATDDVWLRIYDEAGERLKDGLMKKGESFTLPDAARNPMILTGRPQAIAVTVGGRSIPPLGPADRTIADVPVSAGALLARAATEQDGAQGGQQGQAGTVRQASPDSRPARSGSPTSGAADRPAARATVPAVDTAVPAPAAPVAGGADSLSASTSISAPLPDN